MIWEKSSSLNCQEDNITSLENVHRWIVLSLAIVVPGQNVHRWIWQRCHVNVSMPRKFKHLHRWTYETKVVTSLGKNVQRWMWDAYGHMATETCSSLNLWDQSCHLARQKCSTLNSNSWDMDIWPPKHVHRWTYETKVVTSGARQKCSTLNVRCIWSHTETCSSLNLCQLQRHFARQNIGNCAKSCLHRVQLGGL